MMPASIDFTLGENLPPEHRRFVHYEPQVRAYHVIAPERVVANYQFFLRGPALFTYATPLPDGGLRMWFVMGRLFEPRDGTYHNIWWSVDLRQAYIMR